MSGHHRTGREGLTPVALEAGQVIAYLAGRGIDVHEGARVTELADGVSALVYLVEDGDHRVVVKQALAELRVATRWAADPARSATEAAALSLTAALTPGHTPDLVDADEERCVLTMTAAPASLVNLRRRLLEGELDPDLTLSWFSTLGTVLGTWHRATWLDDAIAARFDDDAAFEDLRIDPFYRAAQRAHPGVAGALARCIRELESTRECLVHGDYSPKNVLTDADVVWVLDFEVARFGAAVFDVAFMGHHLLLKAFARPHHAELLRSAFEAFQVAYSTARDGSSPADDPLFPTLGHHLAALALARVDGVSPTRYLTPAQQECVRELALWALGRPDTPAEVLWDRALDLIRSGTRDL